MKPGQFYWVVMIFMMSISYARARQGQALAKIRVDKKGNVEVLQLDANEQNAETEISPLLKSWESENSLSGTLPYSEISSVEQTILSDNHTPADLMSPGPDLIYDDTACNMSYSYPNLTIKVRIKNQGDESAPASILGYYLVEYLGTRKEKIGWDKVPILKPGGLYYDKIVTVDISEYVGKWRVCCIIDDLNSVSEDNESNNVKTFSEPISVGPDLIVTSVTVTDGSGPDIEYQYTIKNQGNASAGNVFTGFKNYIYLSSDKSINPSSDSNIDKHQYSALASNQERNSGTLQTTVSGVLPGDYYLGVIADGAKVISESNEANNTGYCNDPKVTIPQPPLQPDLIVTEVTVIDAQGPDIGYQYTIKNQGNACIETRFKNYIYLSLDNAIDLSDDCDYKIDIQYCSALGSNMESNSGALQSAVDYVPAGDYYLCVYTDGGCDISESNEYNNMRYEDDPKVTNPQPPSQPDLLVTLMVVYDCSGPDIEYEYSIVNRSTASTGTGFKNYIYLSPDKTITQDDYKIDEHQHRVMEAWDHENSVVLQTTVSGVPPGEYYLGIYADGENVISEWDENNNTGYDNDPKVTIPQSHTSQPDLVVTNLTVIDAQGPDISYNVTVKNNGDGPTDGSKIKTRFYLSPDDNITTDDYMIDDWNLTEVFAVGASKTSYNLTSTVSSVPSGDYYLGAITDAEDMISESDENNNTGYCNDPKVTIPQPPQVQPDLIVSSVTVTEGLGPEIEYQYAIQNQGNASTGAGFKNYIYLSTDNIINSSEDYKIGEQQCSALDASADYSSGALQTTVSGVPPGNYYLIVCTDSTNMISESNEANNTGYADTNVTISGGSESPGERESCECNILTNGCFDDAANGWWLFIHILASATETIENGEYSVSISNGSNIDWHIQLLQTGLLIEQGKTYSISFEAYAASPRQIGLYVRRDSSPHTIYSDEYKTYSLTTAKQTYTHHFTMNEPTDHAAAFSFDLGNSDVDVCFDNICLVETVTPSTDIIQDKPSSLPVDFALFQNFPNPFNPSTTIRYAVPKSCHVNLTVYDLVGKEITVLVNETRTPGEYSEVWIGQDLSSGVYICSLQAGDFSETRKLILQK